MSSRDCTLLVSRFHARGPGEIDDLSHQVRTGQRLAQKRFLYLFAMCQLGTRADRGKRGPHQDAARTQLRLWNLVAGHFTGANIFQNGPHDVIRYCLISKLPAEVSGS